MFDKDCLILSMQLGSGSSKVPLSHPALKQTPLLTDRGSPGGRKSGAFRAYKELSTKDDTLRLFAREVPSISYSGNCALATGGLHRVIQVDESGYGKLVVAIDRLEPCAPSAHPTPTQWSQEELVGLLGHLARQYNAGSDEQQRILYYDAVDIIQQFGNEADGSINQWKGIVTKTGAREGNQAELDVKVGCKDCEDFGLNAQLRFYMGDTQMDEAFLRSNTGSCVVFSGALTPEPNFWDRGWEDLTQRPTYKVTPTKLMTCEQASTLEATTIAQTNEEERLGAAAGGALVTGTAAAVIGAGTTQTVPALILVPTASGQPALVLGEVVVQTSSISGATVLGVAGAAAVGFYFLDKAIDESRAVDEANWRELHAEDGDEYLAFARHTCADQPMTSECVRSAFREAATFVAGSQARVDTILGKLEAKSEVQKRWLDQWEDARKYDYGESFFKAKEVIKRVGRLSEGEKKLCREKGGSCPRAYERTTGVQLRRYRATRAPQQLRTTVPRPLL